MLWKFTFLIAKMSKLKKIVDEVRESKGTEIDLVDKGIVNFSEVPGLRKYLLYIAPVFVIYSKTPLKTNLRIYYYWRTASVAPVGNAQGVNQWRTKPNPQAGENLSVEAGLAYVYRVCVHTRTRHQYIHRRERSIRQPRLAYCSCFNSVNGAVSYEVIKELLCISLLCEFSCACEEICGCCVFISEVFESYFICVCFSVLLHHLTRITMSHNKIVGRYVQSSTEFCNLVPNR